MFSPLQNVMLLFTLSQIWYLSHSMRFYSNERIALYTAHLHKDLAGIIEDNILPLLSEATSVML